VNIKLQSSDEQLLRVDEVADLFRTTTRTVYRWLQSGKISGTKIGREWLIPRQSLALLAENELSELATPTTSPKATFSIAEGDHLLALAPQREAVVGLTAKVIEMGLQKQCRVFAACWWYQPDELRQLLRTLGLPAETLEAEGWLEIGDFGTALANEGMGGVLRSWDNQIERLKQDNRPLWGTGAPCVVDCWGDEPAKLVEFEASLDDMLQPIENAVVICVYTLSDFVPNLRRLGTLINEHTGVLVWSETDLMLLRPHQFSL
jgi:excisionase family DNA binding protein